MRRILALAIQHSDYRSETLAVLPMGANLEVDEAGAMAALCVSDTRSLAVPVREHESACEATDLAAAHAAATAGPPPKKRAYTNVPSAAAPSTPTMTPAAIAPSSAAVGPLAAGCGAAAHVAPDHPSVQTHWPVPPLVPEPEQDPCGPQAGHTAQRAPQKPVRHVLHSSPVQPARQTQRPVPPVDPEPEQKPWELHAGQASQLGP